MYNVYLTIFNFPQYKLLSCSNKANKLSCIFYFVYPPLLFSFRRWCFMQGMGSSGTWHFYSCARSLEVKKICQSLIRDTLILPGSFPHFEVWKVVIWRRARERSFGMKWTIQHFAACATHSQHCSSDSVIVSADSRSLNLVDGGNIFGTQLSVMKLTIVCNC